MTRKGQQGSDHTEHWRLGQVGRFYLRAVEPLAGEARGAYSHGAEEHKGANVHRTRGEDGRGEKNGERREEDKSTVPWVHPGCLPSKPCMPRMEPALESSVGPRGCSLATAGLPELLGQGQGKGWLCGEASR